MEYRRLGATDLHLSAIAYGGFAIGGTMWGGADEKEALEAIHASLDLGVTTLDTAPVYGFGRSERLIGEAIRGKDRSAIQILTKFGLVWDGSNHGKGERFFEVQDHGGSVPVYRYAGRANVIKEVEESLGRLGTDYIDLFQLHWPDESTPVEETMEALQTLIDQGKIRAAGVSNYDPEQLKQARAVLPVASNQVPYSMLNRSIESSLIPYAVAETIGILAYSPLERGLLTGKPFSPVQWKPGDHRRDYFAQFPLETRNELLEMLKPIACRKGVTLAQLVLRWTTLQPGITVVLAGARNAQQATENAQAIGIQLAPSEIEFIHLELASILE